MSSLTDPDSAVRYALARWEEGELRVQRATAGSTRRGYLEAVVEALMQELERRIGQIFTTMELVRMQDEAERWCTATAHEVAPEYPDAWELDTVQNAAFHRYARRASDYQLAMPT
jgi:hypothetical protein